MPRNSSLDGLRGVACLLVVIMHATQVFPAAGFLGVAVFFVLSGYLITSLLLKEIEALDTISFGRFLALRCARLLPPVPIVYAICLVLAAIGPKYFPHITPSDVPVILFVTNFWLSLHLNPFPPLTHFWSLATEWQFYFVWPLLLLVLTRVLSRRWLIWVCFVGVLLSWYLRTITNIDTRGLLLGAMIAAMSGDERYRRMATGWIAFAVAPLALAGIVALACIGGPTPWWFNWGTDLVVAFSGIVIFVCANAEHAWMSPLLSHPALRYFGRISYGLYVYNFPLTWTAFCEGLAPWQSALVVLPLSILIADLSLRWIETPVLRFARERMRREVAQESPTFRPEPRHGMIASPQSSVD
jgi:peptidoglycan/LPS O-acetylase OafA/YrhL